ncbi:MAG: hypothetical protein AUJ92_13650 [Armatimonadetes bacterium CG2_30_59_28]|nr:hypothetical protein [Armatimonadota bacterium]OIO92718.1 MAG: hypothetical protein AUJ92_13650 [Armatimonadetes bacterium CG2_30_59_28]PIU63643.1 MAG: hypothetical protein COS85_15455 [Armatimonadetes bacterium CG07_land_8_20_14_0_80_59_28]PJB69992.1 MAG: hypothetical protein CO095_09445 [Armatimonadetes bacterium CG_4_9_14_3_um_filter_58_7]
MPQGRAYIVAFYTVSIVAVAAVSVFVFVGLANFLSLTLALTDAVWLCDVVTEYALRTNSFAQFTKQTVYLSFVYGAIVLVWRRLRKV